MLCQSAAHFPVADGTAVDEIHQPPFKEIAFIVNVKSKKVDLLSIIFRGELDARYDFKGGSPGRGESLVDAVGGIMVG